MTVQELIDLLETKQKDLQVVLPKWSEYVILSSREISNITLRKPRYDGWVHSCYYYNSSVNTEKQDYIVLGEEG